MPAAHLPRRTTVGLGLVSVGLAGCSGSTGARLASAPTASLVAGVAADTDLVVVEQARARLAERQEVLRRTARRHPALRARLRPLVVLHRRHDDVLSPIGAAPTASTVPRIPRDRAAALASVVRQEQELPAYLTQLALRADSGPLARVLASMAAGTAQRVALLSAELTSATAS